MESNLSPLMREDYFHTYLWILARTLLSKIRMVCRATRFFCKHLHYSINYRMSFNVNSIQIHIKTIDLDSGDVITFENIYLEGFKDGDFVRITGIPDLSDEMGPVQISVKGSLKIVKPFL